MNTYTEEQLEKAYDRGFSNGIGIGERKDWRYMKDARYLKDDVLNPIRNTK
jgi:hypothetical protein